MWNQMFFHLGILQLVLTQNHFALQNVMYIIPPTSRTSIYCLVNGQCVLGILAEEGARVKLYVGSLIPLPRDRHHDMFANWHSFSFL